MSLELKYIKSTLLEKATEIDAQLKEKSQYDKPIERSHKIGELSGLLIAIELINERQKNIQIKNDINEILK